MVDALLCIFVAAELTASVSAAGRLVGPLTVIVTLISRLPDMRRAVHVRQTDVAAAPSSTLRVAASQCVAATTHGAPHPPRPNNRVSFIYFSANICRRRSTSLLKTRATKRTGSTTTQAGRLVHRPPF